MTITSVAKPDPGRALAPVANQTTVENPWPLSLLCSKMKDYIDRMSPTWVEAQLVEYKRRPGNRMSFFVVKDLTQNIAINTKAFANVIESAGPQLEDGSHVIMQVKPDYYLVNGQLSLMASSIHVIGLGDQLLALERLRKQLQAEGLFEASRKKPLPFLPGRIGLICGRGAKAKDDVLVNATARWPGAQFVIREVAVQGEACPTEVRAALEELDIMPGVDVIIITRGGGAVEDLLGFSDETLVRAVAKAHTPIVAAIGHETDTPLLDYVADFRASTPTDAAKNVVPDLREQQQFVLEGRGRLRSSLLRLLTSHSEFLTQARARLAMVSPPALLETRQRELANDTLRLRGAAEKIVSLESGKLSGLRGTLRAISPRSTMERGYAVLRDPSKKVLTDISDIKKGDLLEAIVANGSLVASVVGTNSK